MNAVIAVLSAPGRLLERSRGLAQLSFGLVAFLLMMLCAFWIRHAASLNGLPRIAEPFDVAALRAARPAETDNAFVLYRTAVGELSAETIEQILLVQSDASFSGDPYLQQIAARHPAAIEQFRDAADYPDAWTGDPADVPGVVALAKLSLAEAARLQGNGDLSGAWDHIRSALRAGRHLGQRAGWTGRSAGLLVQQEATGRIVDWAAHAKIDHDLLKIAIADLEALDSMTPPDWLTMRYEYLHSLDRLSASTPGQARPELRGSRRLDAFFRNEPERSRRVLRLMFANWLSEWILPADSRTDHVVTGVPSLYDNPDAPRVARRVPPARLQEWYASSDLSTWEPPLVHFLSPSVTESLAGDSIQRANLIVLLAERRYLLDHKELPAGPENLLGLYLDRIPPAHDPSRSLRIPLDFENDPPTLLDTDPTSP